MMFICDKKKDDYITGVVIKPKANNPLYKTWKIENNLVMSWLIKSMTNEVGEILFSTKQSKKFGMHSQRKKTPRRLSRLKAFFMMFVKRIYLLPSTLAV